jgi:hypothetical protein
MPTIEDNLWWWEKDSVWSRPNKVFRNPNWQQEGRYLAKLSRFYSASIL